MGFFCVLYFSISIAPLKTNVDIYIMKQKVLQYDDFYAHRWLDHMEWRMITGERREAHRYLIIKVPSLYYTGITLR